MSIRETKKKRTKEAILDSAISLFSRNGYEQTSIEQIATVAGVGKGTVYSYFHTKKDIIKGFCEYELEEIHSELVTNSNHDDSILKQMLTIYLTVFRYVTKNKEFGRIYMREAVFPDDNGIQDHHEIDNKYFQMLFPILKKGQERGELRNDLELLHITAHFYSLYLVIISAWYTGRIETEDVAPIMGDLFRQALEGLRPPTPPKIDTEKDNE
ncbi:MAG: TetR/AcrR family transcriptional regulator [Desulforhopalus sp.]